MSQCMIFVSAEKGLSAQVGVPGLKKRSAKKGWVFWQFHHEHIVEETGVSDMIYTHPNAELEHQFVSWVEGVLVTEVKEHANGVFSGKMVDSTLVGVHQLEFRSPLKATSGVPTTNPTKQIPPSTPESIQASVDMVKALMDEEAMARRLRPVEDIVSDINKFYAEEKKAWDVVDAMTSKTGGHVPGTDKWESKSDEAKFRIWKRFGRKYLGDTLHRVVKNKAGRESIVSMRAAIDRGAGMLFVSKGDPRKMSSRELSEIFGGKVKAA
jgi:hypothetical protein